MSVISPWMNRLGFYAISVTMNEGTVTAQEMRLRLVGRKKTSTQCGIRTLCYSPGTFTELYFAGRLTRADFINKHRICHCDILKMAAAKVQRREESRRDERTNSLDNLKVMNETISDYSRCIRVR